jgi:hypothetical protein
MLCEENTIADLHFLDLLPDSDYEPLESMELSSSSDNENTSEKVKRDSLETTGNERNT